MRFSTVSILALAGIASANIVDKKACDNKGACVSNSACQYNFSALDTSAAAYNCGSAGTVTYQKAANSLVNFRRGLSALEVVAKADFPTCDLAQPGPDAVLLKQVIDEVTVYGFINYDCTKEVPTETTCWRGTSGINTGSGTLCKFYKNGSVCQSTVTTVWGSCPN